MYIYIYIYLYTFYIYIYIYDVCTFIYIHNMYTVHCVLTTYSSWPFMPTQVVRGFNQVVMLRKTSDAMKTSKNTRVCSSFPDMSLVHVEHMFRKKLLIFHMYFTTYIWYVQHVRRCLALPLMSPPRWDQLHPWRHRALNQRCWIPCCQVKHSETILRSTDSPRINHLFLMSLKWPKCYS